MGNGSMKRSIALAAVLVLAACTKAAPDGNEDARATSDEISGKVAATERDDRGAQDMQVPLSRFLLSGFGHGAHAGVTYAPDSFVDEHGQLVVQVEKNQECFFRSMSETDWKNVSSEFREWHRSHKSGDFSSSIITMHRKQCGL
jgi:hypothetical protein